MFNLSTILVESAKLYPKKPAFTFMSNNLSYSQLNEEANKVANGLSAIGIEAGDKVALTCPNLPAFPVIYYGILKLGAVVVPLNVLLKKEEIEYQLNDCHVKAYFCYVGNSELPMGEIGYAAFKNVNGCEDFFIIMADSYTASPIAGVPTFESFLHDQLGFFEMYQSNPEDTAIIIYTSGTTGQPKGAELTHSNLMFNAIISSDLLNNEPEDVLLIVLPLFHIFGMTVMMNASVYKGSSNILLARFDAASVFDLMENYKVTLFAGVPTMYWSLLNYNDPKFNYKNIGKNLKKCMSGGASLPVKVLEDFEDRFAVTIWEGYGMSEGSPVVTFNQSNVGRKAGSIGTPIWGVDVKLVDLDGKEVLVGEKGELLFRGHNVMKGYYKKPFETKQALQNGWMSSGDIAVKDSDGFYYIVDRTKDMIVRGGMKVYPREVEELMMKHNAVSLVAVIGIPDEKLGEEVKAFIVLKEHQIVSDKDLIEWTKERIASYKYPRFVEFLSTFPMTPTGKIMKKQLRNN